MTPPSCYIMLPQCRLEKLAGMSMLAGASTWITHNTKFQSKAGYLGPRGGHPVQVNCQFWTTLHFLQGALHNKMNKVRDGSGISTSSEINGAEYRDSINNGQPSLTIKKSTPFGLGHIPKSVTMLGEVYPPAVT